MRFRGGIEFDGTTRRWRPVVHFWHDDQGLGPPDAAYQWHDTYVTEAEAAQAYLVQARPALEAMRAEAERTPGATVQINRWGWEERGHAD